MTDGLVVVDKPGGCTSHDVVARLRKAYAQKRVGHAGTLDPSATGVLLVGLGRVTRLLRFLADAGKAYEGRVVFGVATDTLDADGSEISRAPMPLDRSVIERAAHTFTGEIMQVPPMVSAVKIDGRRLHELAREGKEVDRVPRPVRVDRFDLVDFVPGDFPEATVVVECSSGTYVRTLAADLGSALGGCAHLARLRRMRVGSFDLHEAHSLDAVEADPYAVVLTPAAAMRDLARVEVDAATSRAVSHGAKLDAGDLGVSGSEGPFAVCDGSGDLIAVYERHRRALKPAVVLVEAASS